MIYKIIKIGNSIGITLPKKLLSLFDLKQGEEVFIETDLKNKTILIKPIQVAKNEVTPAVVTGMKKFIKQYPKALKNLAKR